MSCLQPGWHTSHATEVKHKVHTFGRVSKDTSGPGYSQVACPNRDVALHDQCAFQCDETLTCYGFAFSVEICNLPA